MPLTHQLIHQDRATAAMCGTHPELAAKTPFILGGHEHEVYTEKVERSTIVKVGQDAEMFGICDIWWDASDNLSSQFSAHQATEFEPDAAVKKFVEEKQRVLDNAMQVPIATLSREMSSARVRCPSRTPADASTHTRAYEFLWSDSRSQMWQSFC